MLDEDSSELAVLSHVGRPDEKVHGLGTSETLLIVQGRHGYISPSWYPPETPRAVPTWNFTVAHCYGIPQVLDEAENLSVLGRLMEHFERRVDHPAHLDPAVAAEMVKGTVGFRLPVTRFICKVKLSQNKDPDTRRRVIEALRSPGPYEHPELAGDMELELSRSRPRSAD